MKISVTQDHIDKGRPRLPGCCPVALAIKSHFPNLKVSVGNPSYSIGEYCGQLTDHVCSKIGRFDYSYEMEPFELEIDYEN